MSIYSANRSAAVGTVAEAKKYTTDINRIMYESEVNNMRIFEACMKYDFTQIQGLREGTILESEIAAIDEASKAEFLENLKKAWEAVKAKLKAAFDAILNKLGNAYRMIAVPAIKRFEKMDDSKFSASTKFEFLAYQNPKIVTSYSAISDDLKKEFESPRPIDGNISRTEIISKVLGKCVDAKEVQPGKLLSAMKEKYFGNKSISLTKSEIEKEIVSVLKMKDVIKDIKTAQKACNDIIDSVTKSIKNTIAKNDVASMSDLNTISSAYQTALTSVANAQCKIYVFTVNSYIKYLTAIMKKLGEEDVVHDKPQQLLLNSYMLETDAMIDKLDDDLPDVVDSDDEFNKIVADTMVEVEDIISDDNKDEE